MGRARETLSKAGLALGAVIVTLLLAEGALRVALPDRLSGARVDLGIPFLRWDAFRGVYLAAGAVHEGVSINGAGRRGPELDPAVANRIVCMGDSSTFGLWIEHEPRAVHWDSYPEHLRELLDAAGRDDWQVVNAGVPGSFASHSLRILRRDILPLEPSIVTLRVGMNDHAAFKMAWIEDPEPIAARRLFYAFGGSRLLHLAIQTLFRLTKDQPGNGPNVPRVQSLDVFRRNLLAFAEESREHGFRLLLIDYPLRPPRGKDDADARAAAWLYATGKDLRNFYGIHARYQQVVREVSRTADIPLLVTAPALLSPDSPGFSGDVVHPDARGMERTAELLYQALERRGWLDP